MGMPHGTPKMQKTLDVNLKTAIILTDRVFKVKQNSVL